MFAFVKFWFENPFPSTLFLGIDIKSSVLQNNLQVLSSIIIIINTILSKLHIHHINAESS